MRRRILFHLTAAVLLIVTKSCVVRPPYKNITVARIDESPVHPVWSRLRALCELRSLGEEDPTDWYLLTPAQLGVARTLANLSILLPDLFLHLEHEKSISFGNFSPAAIDDDTLILTGSNDSPLDQTFYELYRPLSDHDSRWRQLVATYDHVRLESIGRSVEGRTIHSLHIGAHNATRRVLLLFGQHAREWVSVAAGTFVAEHLAQFDLPRNVSVVIVPLVNPDGYEYSTEHDRFWRKNRSRVKQCNLTDVGDGVDLNRNWATDWGGKQSTSSDPCSDLYFGTAPFSEPETQAVRDLTERLSGLVAVLDIHSYSQLVIGPWGYTEVTPPYANLIDNIGLQLATAASLENASYNYGRGASNGLYLASGVATDWYFQRGVLASFAIELRPGPPPTSIGFELPPEFIVPTARDALRLSQVLVKYAANALLDYKTSQQNDKYRGLDRTQLILLWIAMIVVVVLIIIARIRCIHRIRENNSIENLD